MLNSVWDSSPAPQPRLLGTWLTLELLLGGCVECVCLCHFLQQLLNDNSVMKPSITAAARAVHTVTHTHTSSKYGAFHTVQLTLDSFQCGSY